MKNKKAVLRILEAVIAVMIVAGILTYAYVKQVYEPNKDEEVHKRLRVILEETAKDLEIRTLILNEEKTKVKELILGRYSSLIPQEYSIDIAICDLTEICSADEIPSGESEVYSESISISSTLEELSPKELAIFLWEPD
ncbi:MAG: hypothetical protein WC533_01040 [Candidatus Pacearchaeota archaeon]